MKLHKYTECELRNAVKNSRSRRQVLQKLNIVAAGGNYQTLNKAIKYFKIDTSHFTGQNWSKGQTIGPKRPIEDYLSNKYSTNSHSLRKRLIKENYKKEQCECCKLKVWNDKPIPLELNHIDGNHYNNNLDNLEIICPNCHAQTNNYRGKNKSLG